MSLNIVRSGRHKKAGRIIRLTADQWAHLDRVRAATGRPVTEQIAELVRRELDRSTPTSQLRGTA
jgi:hypothetical protein